MDYLLIIYMQSLPRKAQLTPEFPLLRSRADFIYSDGLDALQTYAIYLHILDKISCFTNFCIVSGVNSENLKHGKSKFLNFVIFALVLQILALVLHEKNCTALDQ